MICLVWVRGCWWWRLKRCIVRWLWSIIRIKAATNKSLKRFLLCMKCWVMMKNDSCMMNMVRMCWRMEVWVEEVDCCLIFLRRCSEGIRLGRGAAADEEEGDFVCERERMLCMGWNLDWMICIMGWWRSWVCWRMWFVKNVMGKGVSRGRAVRVTDVEARALRLLFDKLCWGWCSKCRLFVMIVEVWVRWLVRRISVRSVMFKRLFKKRRCSRCISKRVWSIIKEWFFKVKLMKCWILCWVILFLLCNKRSIWCLCVRGMIYLWKKKFFS